MIAIDTNLLVYAHRRDSKCHSIAKHPRICSPASTPAAAIEQVDAWLESPTVHRLAEGEAHWTPLRAVLEAGRIGGPAVHDARIAALCIAHGVMEVWSADRDFTRFQTPRLHNPRVG